MIELYIIVDPCYLNSWLQIDAILWIEELAFVLPSTCNANYYDFPCAPFVDDGCRNTIEHLCLGGCAFHPTAGFGYLRRLHLFCVCITVDELGCLISKSSALEHLTLKYCNMITYLKIPSLLQHLNYLMVSECTKLQLIECKAPNLSTFYFNGGQVKLLFGDLVQVKSMGMYCFDRCNTIYNARANLPSIVPNIETLSISSVSEVSQTRMKHDSVFGDPSHLRKRREYCHENIKTVKISGFCSTKSTVELTCHILENATSLQCLTLDTIDDVDDIGKHVHETGECNPIGRHMIKEAREALLAIERYIMKKGPSTVKLNVLEPCRRCHAFAA
ncbi:unnamed protein product [Triticum turgidum subsp. durum]|uniref:FBD domain-containing protein n=1 Tax=Triticum turgidum subsp. durum TaxID=4567 RepID=A0A9R0WHG0_TRITD|nr:unnamed protein product [Triticum turgidum subsp. durum]